MKWNIPRTIICGIYKITNQINGKFFPENYRELNLQFLNKIKGV